MLNTIARNTKYIVIASASRAGLGNTANMVSFTQAHNVVSSMPGVKQVTPVVGYYREHGQAEGAHEQSMALAVTNEGSLNALVKIFCKTYQQDCILVWNTKSGSVWLVNEKDGMFAKLGDKGLTIDKGVWSQHEAYTLDGNGEAWVVA